MDMPVNEFKRALSTRQLQIGLWVGLVDAYCAEICAGAGFDWLVLDAEHAPNDIRSLLAQLQAVAPYPVHATIRAKIGDTVHIKQLLDLGAQTLLIPVVQTAAQAAELVRATRYPPVGVRGVGSALARASRWNRIHNYLAKADEQICLIAQVETPLGMANAGEIARVPGIDGVFIGPADLSAALGHRGQPDHPEVQAVMEKTVALVLASGKAVGTLLSEEALARKYIALGCSFVAVGVDTALMAQATQTLATRYKRISSAAPTAAGGGY